jgi:hypothetical protein
MSKESKENKPKSNSSEVESRINKIFDLLINGASKSNIVRYVAEKTEWNISERQLENYISEANKRIIEIGQTHRETELGRAIARLNNLYFMSVTLQNFNVALGVQKELNKLLGLNLEEGLIRRVEALESGAERLSELKNISEDPEAIKKMLGEKN